VKPEGLNKRAWTPYGSVASIQWLLKEDRLEEGRWGKDIPALMHLTIGFEGASGNNSAMNSRRKPALCVA
jgi:hypothetical protein